MLVANLIVHQLKSFSRKAGWRRNSLSKIINIIFILYIVFVLISFDLFIDNLMKTGGMNFINLFNFSILIYFTLDLLLRSLIQALPVIQFIPYLRFRIARYKLVDYYLFICYLNIFNIIPWIVLIPFSIKTLYPTFGAVNTFIYLIDIFILITLNNYLAVLINILLRNRIILVLIPLSVLAALAVLTQSGYSINYLSIVSGKLLFHGNLSFLLIVSFSLIIVIYITRRFLIMNFCVGESGKNYLRALAPNIELTLLKNINGAGRYLWLEIILLLRNKRSRSVISIIPIVMLYLGYSGIYMSNHATNIFLFLLTSCVIPIAAASYGQFLFSWESSYFDGILARKINFPSYIMAKYYLLIILVLAISVPFCILFIISDNSDLLLLISILAFTIGVICFIILFFGTYNDGRIEINQNKWFKYEGVKGTQFILSGAIMLLPLTLYLILRNIFNETVGKLVIAIPGALFFIYHKWWITRIIIPRFMARKYKNLEGYRKLTS
jgi:hypothetical protein